MGDPGVLGAMVMIGLGYSLVAALGLENGGTMAVGRGSVVGGGLLARVCISGLGMDAVGSCSVPSAWNCGVESVVLEEFLVVGVVRMLSFASGLIMISGQLWLSVSSSAPLVFIWLYN